MNETYEIDNGEVVKEWITKVMMRRPKNNIYLDSVRGEEVTRLCFQYEVQDFNWHRSDDDTFWLDVQMFVKYKLSDEDILFILQQQPGVDNYSNYSKHSKERNAYAELMRGLEKLRRLNRRPIQTEEK